MTVRQWIYRNLYMRSPGWRLTKLIRKGGYCQRCGTKKRPLDLHHKNYYGYGVLAFIFPDLISELRVLCRNCHNKEHGK